MKTILLFLFAMLAVSSKDIDIPERLELWYCIVILLLFAIELMDWYFEKIK